MAMLNNQRVIIILMIGHWGSSRALIHACWNLNEFDVCILCVFLWYFSGLRLNVGHQFNEFWWQSSALKTRFLVESMVKLISVCPVFFSAEDRGNYAQQTSLHAACEGNFANIVVDLLAAGLEKHSMYFRSFDTFLEINGLLRSTWHHLIHLASIGYHFISCFRIVWPPVQAQTRTNATVSSKLPCIELPTLEQ